MLNKSENIVWSELQTRCVPESFVQYFDFSGELKVRDSLTNELITLQLANCSEVQQAARIFGIKPGYQY
ncbi:hypothetical protein [Dendrosporobacter sp. 1207_IL3150]|uniref:hypothetical protein n=1 Tax=Dendrosporobacter sp. 1207_IL3150 TaxID=3084054 RepID=UPI002FD96730